MMNLEKLKEAIESSKLTKKEIAARSGISAQALNSILSHDADPKVSNIESIARTIGMRMSVLFDETSIQVSDNAQSFNSNADDIIRRLTDIIKSQEDRITFLTNRLLGL